MVVAIVVLVAGVMLTSWLPSGNPPDLIIEFINRTDFDLQVSLVIDDVQLDDLTVKGGERFHTTVEGYKIDASHVITITTSAGGPKTVTTRADKNIQFQFFLDGTIVHSYFG